jgi:hypothetical protein
MSDPSSILRKFHARSLEKTMTQEIKELASQNKLKLHSGKVFKERLVHNNNLIIH